MAPVTVLLVDTHPVQRAGYAAALGRVIGSVKTAATFAEARQRLPEVKPDVLVTQVRLAEFNGIHLAMWARQRLPQLRCVIIGQSDPALEGDVRLPGCVYLRFSDDQAVVQATLEAIAREIPRRQWLRKRVPWRLAARIDEQDAVLCEVGYGGFSAETTEPLKTSPNAQLTLSIPAFAMRTNATCRWITRSASSGLYACGASLADAEITDGSQWRTLVDALSAA